MRVVKKSESVIYIASILGVYLFAVFLTMWGPLNLVCYSGGQALNITFTSGRIAISHNNSIGISGSGIKPSLEQQDPFAPYSLSARTSTLPSIKDALWYLCPPVALRRDFGILRIHIPFWLIALICLVPLLVITIIDIAQRKQNDKRRKGGVPADI